MKKVLGFYRMFWQTLNIKSYEGFAESTLKNSFNYYASLVFNAFVLMLVVLIPAFVQLPNTVESYFNNIDTFNFNINFKTNAPIVITKGNPLLIINYANETPTQNANIILNNNVLYTGFLLQRYVKDFSIYEDAKANKSPVSNIIGVLLLLMAPTLALLFFFYLLLKYFIIVLIATLAAMLLAPLMRYRITTKSLFNCAMYGISLSVFLDIIFFALGFRFFQIQYLPLVVFMIAGIIQSGEKIDSKMKGKYIEVK